MSPSWYDVLGVSRDASPEEIKAAWRDATDKFEPGRGSSQFRMFNEAADVLLDPERRAAYDAELDGAADASTEPDTAPSAKPAPEQPAVEEPPATDDAKEGAADDTTGDEAAERVTEDEAAAEATTEATAGAASRRAPSRILRVLALIVLPILTAAAIVLAVIAWNGHRADERTETARDQAPPAAEKAVTTALSYDYRHMPSVKAAALKVMTPSYAKTYLQSYKLLTTGKNGAPGPVESTKAVVTATVLDSAVVDASPDRVRVLVFVNQASQKGSATPSIFQNRVTVTMLRTDGQWLIDDIQSY